VSCRPECAAARIGSTIPHRLLRKMLVLPGGITISAEKRKGRVMVRVEVPEEENAAGSVNGLGNLVKSG
jgi:hypothetical protein